jgi:hypothetical protein
MAARARQMRIAPTASEAKLWAALRGSRIGIGLRRQAVIGSYIVDFVAPSVRLVVEVDGGYHAGRCRADERRDRILVAPVTALCASRRVRCPTTCRASRRPWRALFEATAVLPMLLDRVRQHLAAAAKRLFPDPISAPPR